MPVIGDRRGKLFGLRARDRLERGFVLLGVPDLLVVARLAAGADAQDEAIEDDLPEQALIFDHARIGKEFLQIDPHAAGVRRIGGAEVDQQHADALRQGCRRRLGMSNGGGRGHDGDGFARCTILVKARDGSIRLPIDAGWEEP